MMEEQQALIVHNPHPILAEGRRILPVYDIENKTIADCLIDQKIDLQHRPHILYHNDKIIPLEEWNDYYVSENDIIILKSTVEGGNFKALLSLVAMMALVYFSGGWATAIAGEGASAGAVALTKAAIVGVGSLAISALTRPSMPKMEGEAASSTYSLSGASNRPKPYGVIPWLAGRMRVYADLSNTPYTFYKDSENYLRFSLCFGHMCSSSSLLISDLKIGETSVDDYDNVDVEYSPTDTGRLDNWPQCATNVEFGEIKQADGATVRVLPLGVSAVCITITGRLQAAKKSGKSLNINANYTVKYRAAGSSDAWVVLYQNGDEFPGGVTGQLWMGQKSTKPFARSWWVEIPAGKGDWEIQVTKLCDEQESSIRYFRELTVNVLAFKDYEGDPGGTKQIGVQIKATAQLSGMISNMSAICEQTLANKLPSRTSNRNPANVFYQLCRGVWYDNVLQVGVGASDDEIDIDGLCDWYDYCETYNLTFDHVYDSPMTCYDALAMPAFAGRASISFAQGKLGVIYDYESTPCQMLSAHNILANSYSQQFIAKDLADEISIEFLNEDLNYARDVVTYIEPGVTYPQRTMNLPVPGITVQEMAETTAKMTMASNVFRRKIISLQTDNESLILQRGDRCTISHSCVEYAQSARLVTGSTTTHLYLDTELYIDHTQSTLYVGVRKPDGILEYCEVTNPGSTGYFDELDLTDALSEAPATDECGNWLIQFDYKPTPGEIYKVIDIKPSGSSSETFALTLIEDPPDFYAMMDDSTAADWPSGNVNAVSGRNVAIVISSYLAGSQIWLDVAWTNTGDATGSHIYWRKLGAGSWTDEGEVIGSTYYNHISWTIPDAAVVVKLVPIGSSNPGTASYAYYVTNESSNYLYSNITIPDITGLEMENYSSDANHFDDSECQLSWDHVYPIIDNDDDLSVDGSSLDHYLFDCYELEIWETLGILRDTITDIEEPEYVLTREYMESISDSGMAYRDFYVRVYYKAKNGKRGNYQQLHIVNTAPAAPTFTTEASTNNIIVTLEKPDDIDFTDFVIWMDTNPSFIPDDDKEIYRGPNTTFTAPENAEDTWYFKVAACDTWGDRYDNDYVALGDCIIPSSVQSTPITTLPAVTEIWSLLGVRFYYETQANQVKWTAGKMMSNQDGAVYYTISASNYVMSSTPSFLYWNESTPNALYGYTDTQEHRETVADAGGVIVAYMPANFEVYTTGFGGKTYVTGSDFETEIIGDIIEEGISTGVIGEHSVSEMYEQDAGIDYNTVYCTPTTETGSLTDLFYTPNITLTGGVSGQYADAILHAKYWLRTIAQVGQYGFIYLSMTWQLYDVTVGANAWTSQGRSRKIIPIHYDSETYVESSYAINNQLICGHTYRIRADFWEYYFYGSGSADISINYGNIRGSLIMFYR